MSASNRELQELDEIINYLTSSQSATVMQRPHLPGSESQENLATAGKAEHVYDEFSQDIFGLAPPPPAPLVSEQKVTPNIKATQKLNSSLDELKLMLSAPQDVLPPPLLQPAASQNVLKLTKSLDDLKAAEFNYYGEEPSAQERQYDEERQQELRQLTHVIKFDEMAPGDFQDFDKLVNDLNSMMIKRSSFLSSSNSATTSSSNSNYYRQVPPRRIIHPAPVKNTIDLNNDDTKPLVYTKMQLQENSMSAESTPAQSPDSDLGKEEKIRLAMLKLNDANIKKITIRIYIEDSRVFKTLVLTSLMSASDVIRELEKRYSLRDSPYWSLFEVLNDKRIERPLREYEIVTDVIKTWDVETSNALLVKQYKYRDSLSIKAAYEIPAAMHGWLYLEKKKDKWQKYFFELKPKGIFFSKDIKGTGEQMLCSTASMEVYTQTLAPKNKSPSKFCFIIQATRAGQKEKMDLYCLCTDSIDNMKDWVLSIRSAKSQVILRDHPEYLRRNTKRPSQAEPQPEARSEPVNPNNVKLINRIEKQQGLLDESKNELVNKTQFGEGGKPLVAFTARELQNVPGVKVEKYSASKPQNNPTTKIQASVRPCKVCGCTDFARNPFRETSCANCFHQHN